MAEAFKNASAELGTVEVIVYTCPAATSAVVFSGYISNKDGTQSINVNAKVFDSSTSALITFIGKDTPINIGGALTLDKIGLEAGDEIRMTSDIDASSDTFLSILELT